VSARGDGSRRPAGRYRVSLANRQRAVRVGPEPIRRLAGRVLRAACPEGADLSVLLVDDAAMTRLNAAWRGRRRPTDVLSFSQVEGGGPVAPGVTIGDVVISLETARRQARERGRPLGEEVGALLVHGVLHLLGYDHEQGPAAARRMLAREREVAAAAGLPAVALGDRPRAPEGGRR
jgi:probable rRNA maturation factor